MDVLKSKGLRYVRIDHTDEFVVGSTGNDHVWTKPPIIRLLHVLDEDVRGGLANSQFNQVLKQLGFDSARVGTLRVHLKMLRES